MLSKKKLHLADSISLKTGLYGHHQALVIIKKRQF